MDFARSKDIQVRSFTLPEFRPSSRRNTDLHHLLSTSPRDLYKVGRNTAKFRLSSDAWERIPANGFPSNAEVTKGRKKADGESFLPSFLPSMAGSVRT